MIRLVCALGLLAVGVLLALVVRTTASTALAFVFVGGPALVASVVLYWSLEHAALRRALVEVIAPDDEDEAPAATDASPPDA